MADSGTLAVGVFIVGASSTLTAVLVAVHNWKRDKQAELQLDVVRCKEELAGLKAKLEAISESHRSCEERYAALNKQFLEHLVKNSQ